MKKLFPVLIVTLLLIATGSNVFSQVTTVPAGTGPYANLGAAFTAINAGGVYTGAAVTVTITADLAEPAGAFLNGGVFASCLITPSGARTVSGSFNEAIIVLDGADNVTIDGLNTGGNSLTITNPNTGLASGVLRMSNGAQSNIIRNCTCNGFGSGGTVTPLGGRTVYIAQSTTAVGNNNNIIENNVVNRGRRCVQIFGTASLVTNDNNIVRNNIVKNASSLQIFIGSETVNNTVTGNEIFNDEAVTGDVAPRGINIQGVGVNEVRNNRIHDVSYASLESGANGLIGILSIPVILTAPGSGTTTVNIINNMVAYTDNNDPAGFIYCVAPLSTAVANAQAYTANVYNNSCNIAGVTSAVVNANTSAIAVSVATPFSIINVANNIAINTRTGGNATSFHVGDDEASQRLDSVTFKTDYNFSKADTSGGNRGFDGGYAGRVFRSDGGLELMKDTACIQGNGQHNMYKRVNFVSPTNLHLAGGIGGDLCGKPLALVPLDIDGTPRNATYPYRGADEGTAFKIFTMGGCLQGAYAISGIDQVTVVLKTPGCGIISSCTADLIPPGAAGGTAVFCFGDSTGAGPYYIDVINRNHLETFSAAPIAFGGAPSYDFRGARTQAFNSNMTVAGPPFCFYGGDVNQDGVINSTDVIAIHNDDIAFVNGCRVGTDINNDGVVNSTDKTLAFNNNILFINSLFPLNRPCNPEPSSISTFNNNQNTVVEKVNSRNREMINSMIF